MKPRLLILHDSIDFGGHERMLIRLLPGVLDGGMFDTTFCLSDRNGRLAERLDEEFPDLRLLRWPFAKQRGEPYLRRLRWAYGKRVRDLARAERPDVVLLVQGRIENLAVPMTALPAGLRVVSYIPMAHRLDEMKRNGAIGDRFRLPLYRRPDRFIVPSEAVAAQVRKAGGIAPVDVVENVVEPPPQTPRLDARTELGLPRNRRTALFLGRLDPVQKGLDRLLGALARGGAGLSEWSFLFVGDGPGEQAIRRTADETGLAIRTVSWTERPDLFLSAADVLLLPSRWEGLPLVMLEAMHYRLPILASAIDVYRDYLPPEAIVDFDTVGLSAALDRATTLAAVDRFARHCDARLGATTLEASRARFARALAAEVPAAKIPVESLAA